MQQHFIDTLLTYYTNTGTLKHLLRKEETVTDPVKTELLSNNFRCKKRKKKKQISTEIM